MDLTAGIRPKLGPLQFDFGIIYYNYPNERRLLNFLQTTDYTLPDGTVLFTGPTILTVRNTDFLEGAAKVSWSPTDALTFGANVFHTSNWLGSHAPGTYASLTGKYNIPQGAFGFLPEGFSISAEAGRYYLGTTSPQLGRVRLPDYNYGNVGISYTYKNFTFDVRYHDTNLSKRECFTLTTDPQGVFTGSGRSNWCDSRVIGRVAPLHELPARLGAEQPDRACAEGNIIRHGGRAEQRFGHASSKPLGRSNHLVSCTESPSTDEHGHPLARIQHLRCPNERSLAWHHGCRLKAHTGVGHPVLVRGLLHRLHLQVVGQNHAGDAALGFGDAVSPVDEMADLGWGGGGLYVGTRDILEQGL